MIYSLLDKTAMNVEIYMSRQIKKITPGKIQGFTWTG